jgi:hypothetical protein
MSFTQASLRRAIDAARKAGLIVTAIRPDGTLILNEQKNNPQATEALEKEREVVL